MKQRTQDMISLECRNSWLTQCQDALKYSWEGKLKTWTRLKWNWNRNPLPSCAFPFYALSILTSMSSSEIPYIIGTSPDDAQMMSWSVLAGKSTHVPGQLSGDVCSEQRHQSGYSALPLLWREKWWPQVPIVTHSPRYFDVPPCQVSQSKFI